MPSGDNTEDPRTFCDVCRHRVMNMEKHLQSSDHRRQVRRETGPEYKETSPRLRGQSRAGSDEALFPGRLLLKRRAHGG